MIKIPICEFGKKLGITDMIDNIRYTKGDFNDKGDNPKDYVEIIFVDEYKPVILEHDGVKEIMVRGKVDEVREGKLTICPKCSYYSCLCKYHMEKL